MLEIIRKTINEFCQEFVRNPYLCYTEHGQHALFYSMLYAAIPDKQKFIFWDNQKICVIQKEYPTAATLDKPQRQHWDIAVLKSPPESLRNGPGSYDYLKLFAVVEFGLNESEEHLQDDINRLCHQDSNIENRFIIHLYRLSKGGVKFSGRDWSPESPRIKKMHEVKEMANGKPIEIFYGLADSTGLYTSGICDLKNE